MLTSTSTLIEAFGCENSLNLGVRQEKCLRDLSIILLLTQLQTMLRS